MSEICQIVDSERFKSQVFKWNSRKERLENIGREGLLFWRKFTPELRKRMTLQVFLKDGDTIYSETGAGMFSASMKDDPRSEWDAGMRLRDHQYDADGNRKPI